MISLGMVLTLIYIVLIVVMIIGWSRISVPATRSADLFVSVVIPVRNEGQTIQSTINSILENDYPADRFEVLVVNDHSDDETESRVKQIKDRRVRFLNLEEGRVGKKKALTHGVTEAQGKLILCTDGDTIVPKEWIRTHALSFVEGNILSFGPVQYQSSGLMSSVLNIELSALVMVGGATIGLGFPSMINGCNYSFSKKAFQDIKGFEGNENLPTGDDEFLLRKVHQTKMGSVAFLKSKDAMVTTEAVSTMAALVQQRRRWASKWKHHKDWGSKLLPILVFVFYALFMAAIGWAIAEYPLLGGILIGMKVVADYVMLATYLQVMKLKPDWGAMLLMQIIYPFYVLFFGLASNFGHYDWKGRKHHV